MLVIVGLLAQLWEFGCVFKQTLFQLGIDEVATDEGLKESLIRYAIESGVIVEQVYQKEMAPIIEDMKRYMDGLLHIYDKSKDGKLTSEMFRLSLDARTRLEESND